MSQAEEWKELRRKRRRRFRRRLVLVIAVIVVFCASLRIRSVNIEGNEHYSDAELESILFENSWDRNPFVFIVKNWTHRLPDIPFVDRLSVTLTGLQTADIIVYEKNMIGYVSVSGSNYYFDRDGIVVEKTKKAADDIPKVTGIGAKNPQVGEKLQVSSETVLNEILNVSQYLTDTSVEWNGEDTRLVDITESVDVDEDEAVTVDFGDVSVFLGTSDYMEEKLLTMTDILPELSGRTGTLYLDTYDPNSANPAYVFK